MNRPIFIISAGRSGSTAMVKILETAKNSIVFNEPEPKLCIEARLLYEFGEQAIDIESIIKYKKKIIEKNIKDNYIYIDKNQNYVFFMKYFRKYLNAKFIILFRDGRDVIRSYMDWVNVMGKRIYLTHEDIEDYDYVSPCNNIWNYSYIRPKKYEKIYKKWKQLSLFEKFCWYWAKINHFILKNIKVLTIEDYYVVNMSKINIKDIKEIFKFCNLKGFESEKIEEILKKRINSIQDRINKPDVFPKYEYWQDELKKIYNKYTKNITYKIERVINEYKTFSRKWV